MSTKDKAGREIKVGDFIVYGHALGRCAALRFGRVRDIYEADDPYGGYGNRPKKKHHFRIRGVDFEGWNSKEAPKLLSKDSTLQFADRIMVLMREQVPEAVQRLFDGTQS